MQKSRICSTGSMLQMAGALQVTVESTCEQFLVCSPDAPHVRQVTHGHPDSHHGWSACHCCRQCRQSVSRQRYAMLRCSLLSCLFCAPTKSRLTTHCCVAGVSLFYIKGSFVKFLEEILR